MTQHHLETTGQLAASAQQPSASIQLSQTDAARWLRALNRILGSAEGDGLEQFRDTLADECWLARWKREDVIVEFSLLDRAECLETLLERTKSAENAEELQTLEEMLQAITQV